LDSQATNMTEAEWWTCTSPEAILNFLTDKASPRKLRLYAIGCCRRIWQQLSDDRCRYAVEVSQRFVDGLATEAALFAAGQVVMPLAKPDSAPGSPLSRPTSSPAGAAWSATRTPAWFAAWDTAWDARMVARDSLAIDWEQERAWQATLLLDLFGNPFRRVRIDPGWLLEAGGAVRTLAQVIYEDDRFGDLPILADALEEAGCTCSEILDHCRTPRAHYRGCWVVDAVLGFV
jgi:hypothetical protein